MGYVCKRIFFLFFSLFFWAFSTGQKARKVGKVGQVVCMYICTLSRTTMSKLFKRVEGKCVEEWKGAERK